MLIVPLCKMHVIMLIVLCMLGVVIIFIFLQIISVKKFISKLCDVFVLLGQVLEVGVSCCISFLLSFAIGGQSFLNIALSGMLSLRTDLRAWIKFSLRCDWHLLDLHAVSTKLLTFSLEDSHFLF